MIGLNNLFVPSLKLESFLVGFIDTEIDVTFILYATSIKKC